MIAELFIQSSAMAPEKKTFEIALSDGSSELKITGRQVYLNGTEITGNGARRIRDAASDYFAHVGEEMTGRCGCPANAQAAERTLIEILEPYRRSLVK